MPGASAKTEPQMNADERRFVAPWMCINWRGAGSMRLAARGTRGRWWVRAKGRGIVERGAQDFSISTTAEKGKVAKINGFVL